MAETRGSRALKKFAVVWLCVFLAVFTLSAIGHITLSQSKWDGFTDVVSWVSPWNISSFAVNVLSLMPAFLAWRWAERLETKAQPVG